MEFFCSIFGLQYFYMIHINADLTKVLPFFKRFKSMHAASPQP